MSRCGNVYYHVMLVCFLAVDVKSGKGMIESEGFMNALSTQAAKMKGKKAKRQGKGSKPSRTSSTSSSGPDAKQAKEEGTELMEGVCVCMCVSVCKELWGCTA